MNSLFIGSLLVTPYSVAYWSALNFYGVTEQIPNTVFLQTTSRKKKQATEVFGVRYRIVRVKEEKFFGIRKEWIEDTQVHITDKEKTLLDCLDKPQYCGGVVEVAKALKYGSELDKKKLVEYAQKIENSGVIRRLGYLCDLFAIDIGIPKIKTRDYLLLDPTMSHKGQKKRKMEVDYEPG